MKLILSAALLVLLIAGAFAESLPDMGMGGMGGMGTMMSTDTAKGKAEIGNFYYPGSEITDSAVSDMMGQKTVMVVMTTSDSLEKIASYYSPMFKGDEDVATITTEACIWTHPEGSDTNAKVLQVSAAQDAGGDMVTIVVSKGQAQKIGQ
jgi:hypothetical protein